MCVCCFFFVFLPNRRETRSREMWDSGNEEAPRQRNDRHHSTGADHGPTLISPRVYTAAVAPRCAGDKLPATAVSVDANRHRQSPPLFEPSVFFFSIFAVLVWKDYINCIFFFFFKIHSYAPRKERRILAVSYKRISKSRSALLWMTFIEHRSKHRISLRHVPGARTRSRETFHIPTSRSIFFFNPYYPLVKAICDL